MRTYLIVSADVDEQRPGGLRRCSIRGRVAYESGAGPHQQLLNRAPHFAAPIDPSFSRTRPASSVPILGHESECIRSDCLSRLPRLAAELLHRCPR